MERKINRIKVMLAEKGKTNGSLPNWAKTQQRSVRGVRTQLSQPSKL